MITIVQEFGVILITRVKVLSYKESVELTHQITKFYESINPFLYVEN